MGKNSVSISYSEKKLKLFGVELDPSQPDGETDRPSSVEDDDESVSSSSPSSTVSGKPSVGETGVFGEEPPPPPPPRPSKKFKCPCCLKVFTNSQALGGHQNAHKNERMRKKKLQLQLQARKATNNLNYYYINNPIFNKFCDKNSENLVNFCGSTKPALFNKEVQINFGSDMINYDHKISRCNDYYMQQNKHRFSLTQVEGSRKNLSPSSPESKRICTRKELELDLQLGLG